MSSHDSSNKQPRYVAAIGMFDGVHRGHAFLLAQLKALALRLGLKSEVVTFTNHPLEVVAPERAPGLLMDQAQKIHALKATGIDSVVAMPFDEALRLTSAGDFMALLHVRFGVAALLLGYNNRFGHDAPRDFEAYRQLAASQGIELFRASEFRQPGEPTQVSSSEIRKLLERGDVEGAALLLGHPYRLEGTVVGGRQIGRQLGYPTANLSPSPPRRLVPAPGVYACRATLPDGTLLPAMVNIGTNPTVRNVESDTDTAQPGSGRATVRPSSTGAATIEAHIIGFSGDLYGRQLGLDFICRLRPETAFPSLEALATQLDADRAATLRALSPQPFKGG